MVDGSGRSFHRSVPASVRWEWCKARVIKIGQHVLDAVPVFNTEFWTASNRAHADAFKEFMIVFTIALMPFWLGALLTLGSSFGDPDAANANWFDFLFRSQYARGQLFLAAASALGTVLWLSLKEFQAGQFPDRLWFVLISLIVAMVAAAFYGVEYAYGPEQFKERIPAAFLIPFSEGIMVMTCVLYYASSVLNNALLEFRPQQEMRDRDDKFSDDYSKHR